jgi:uncharacterized protein (DUF2236 family)
MQAAHPVAFEGFFAATTALADPYARLQRTAQVIDTIVFGERAAADEQTARVRRIHSRVRGRLLPVVPRRLRHRAAMVGA